MFPKPSAFFRFRKQCQNNVVDSGNIHSESEYKWFGKHFNVYKFDKIMLPDFLACFLSM